jgi:hypothetical protein
LTKTAGSLEFDSMNSSLQQAIRLLKLLLKNPGDEDVRALVTAFIAGMEQSERIALGQEIPPPPVQNVAERGREILERVAQRGRETLSGASQRAQTDTAGQRIPLGPALDLVDGKVEEVEPRKRPREEETRGTEPYGFYWHKDEQGRRVELREDPNEQACLLEIARLRNEEGLSYRQIVTALNAHIDRFKPRDARRWQVGNVRLRLEQLRAMGKIEDRPARLRNRPLPARPTRPTAGPHQKID